MKEFGVQILRPPHIEDLTKNKFRVSKQAEKIDIDLKPIIERDTHGDQINGQISNKNSKKEDQKEGGAEEEQPLNNSN